MDRAPPTLSVEDLAIFDPCAKKGLSHSQSIVHNYHVIYATVCCSNVSFVFVSFLSSFLSDQSCGSPDHSELLSLKLTNPNGAGCGQDEGYVAEATKELNAAQEREKEGEYSEAVLKYRTAVDIFMKGVHGEEKAKRQWKLGKGYKA